MNMALDQDSYTICINSNLYIPYGVTTDAVTCFNFRPCVQVIRMEKILDWGRRTNFQVNSKNKYVTTWQD